jgi:hypothetical protein
MRTTLARLLDELHTGSAHEALRRTFGLARLAEQGHSGLADALMQTRAAFHAEVTRPGRRGSTRTADDAEQESRRSLAGAVRKVVGSAVVDPDEPMPVDPCEDPFAALDRPYPVQCGGSAVGVEPWTCRWCSARAVVGELDGEPVRIPQLHLSLEPAVTRRAVHRHAARDEVGVQHVDVVDQQLDLHERAQPAYLCGLLCDYRAQLQQAEGAGVQAQQRELVGTDLGSEPE